MLFVDAFEIRPSLGEKKKGIFLFKSTNTVIKQNVDDNFMLHICS